MRVLTIVLLFCVAFFPACVTRKPENRALSPKRGGIVKKAVGKTCIASKERAADLPTNIVFTDSSASPPAHIKMRLPAALYVGSKEPSFYSPVLCDVFFNEEDSVTKPFELELNKENFGDFHATLSKESLEEFMKIVSLPPENARKEIFELDMPTIIALVHLSNYFQIELLSTMLGHVIFANTDTVAEENDLRAKLSADFLHHYLWRIFIASAEGLKIAAADGTLIATRTAADGLGGGQVSSVVISREGRVYVGTSEGLKVSDDWGLSFKKMIVNPKSHAAGMEHITCLSISSDNNLYVGTNDGLDVLVHGAKDFRHQTLVDRIVGGWVYALAITSSNLYVGTDNGLGLLKRDGGGVMMSGSLGNTTAIFPTYSVTSASGEPRLAGNHVRGIGFTDNRSKMFIAIDSGVTIINRKDNSYFNITNASAPTFPLTGISSVGAVYQGKNLIAAIGSKSGLWVWQAPNLLSAHTAADGLPSDEVVSTVFSPAGKTLYISTVMGLAVSKDFGATVKDISAQMEINKSGVGQVYFTPSVSDPYEFYE